MSRFDLLRAVAYTAVIAGVTMIALVWGAAVWPDAPARAVTLSFTTLALAEIFHLGNARSGRPVLSLPRALANRYAIAAVVITVGLQVLAVNAQFLRKILDTTGLTLTEWAAAFTLAAVPAIVGQLWKLIVSLGRR